MGKNPESDTPIRPRHDGAGARSTGPGKTGSIEKGNGARNSGGRSPHPPTK